MRLSIKSIYLKGYSTVNFKVSLWEVNFPCEENFKHLNNNSIKETEKPTVISDYDSCRNNKNRTKQKLHPPFLIFICIVLFFPLLAPHIFSFYLFGQWLPSENLIYLYQLFCSIYSVLPVNLYMTAAICSL